MDQLIMTADDVQAKLQHFKFKRLLEDDPLTKRIVLLGTIEKDDAILTLEKTGFNSSVVQNDILQYLEQIEVDANNDVYHWGKVLAASDLKRLPTCKFNLIHPASETHIRKYEKSTLRMIRETPEAYEKVVKPYIDSMKGDRIQWVKNILYHGEEAERVLFKNEDYIILPDMKWDGKDVSTMYCCCIVYDEQISSLRELTATHTDYLWRIRESILTEVPRIYGDSGITRDQLRLYVHYQPSYYHFHIHVVNSNFLGLANSMLAGKAILLDDIIDNLQFLGDDGYSKKTITYQLKDTHALWGLGLSNYFA
jgi:m7GpppX diphosphatase